MLAQEACAIVDIRQEKGAGGSAGAARKGQGGSPGVARGNKPSFAFQATPGRLHSLRERSLADREGFEPSERLITVHTLSRRAPSATRPPVRVFPGAQPDGEPARRVPLRADAFIGFAAQSKLTAASARCCARHAEPLRQASNALQSQILDLLMANAT